VKRLNDLFIILGVFLMALLVSEGSRAQVVDTSALTRPTLAEGQCHTLSDGKYYWKDLQGPEKLSLRLKIGETLVSQVQDGAGDTAENTSGQVYFFCQARCLLQNTEHFLWFTQSDQIDNFNRMDSFVCRGLEVADVALSPTLTIKTTVARPFAAALSRTPEVHALLQALSYKIAPNQVGPLLQGFYSALQITIQSYSMASSGLFPNAAIALTRFSSSDENAWPHTLNKIQDLQNRQWKTKDSLFEMDSAEDLVDLFFVTQGRFLQYL
jgi:hypothetical protein